MLYFFRKTTVTLVVSRKLESLSDIRKQHIRKRRITSSPLFWIPTVSDKPFPLHAFSKTLILFDILIIFFVKYICAAFDTYWIPLISLAGKSLDFLWFLEPICKKPLLFPLNLCEEKRTIALVLLQKKRLSPFLPCKTHNFRGDFPPKKRWDHGEAVVS